MNAAPRSFALGKSAEREDLIIRRRRRLVERLAPASGAVLLDFGCGNGAQTVLFSPDFDLTIGVDVTEGPLWAFAKEVVDRGLGEKTFAIRYDGHRIPLRNDSIDYAISFEVLEHVASEQGALSELARVIRPGGTLAMSVPNRWWLFETHGASLPILPWNRVPFFSWLPKRIHDRFAGARIYRRREIIGKLEAAGFEVRCSRYVTAPMDVVKWKWMQAFLRGTFFRGDTTVIPFLATAIMIIARVRGR